MLQYTQISLYGVEGNMASKESVYEKVNLPPETLVYTGKHTREPLSVQIAIYDEHSIETYQVKHTELVEKLRGVMSDSRPAWIDVVGICDVNAMEVIGATIGLPQLYIEDIVNVSQRSKLETTETGLFAVTKMLSLQREQWRKSGSIEITCEHLSLVLCGHVVVTFQENQGDIFDDIRSRMGMEGVRVRKAGADYLFYALFDALVDHQLDILHAISASLELIEQSALDGGKVHLGTLYQIRRDLLTIKSASFPMQDMVMTLLDEDMEWIDKGTKVYFRDVADHMSHVTEQIILYREMVNNLYEMHMLDTSNNLNRVMTTLTIFSAIFIPLNFLAGFFGMNFIHFDLLRYPNAIPTFLLVCVLIGGVMMLYFRRKEWF
jgi:magnesium transporter